MSSCAKIHNDPLIRSIVSSKNVKRTFLSPEPLPNDFSKILFHGDIVNNGIYLCDEFHGRRPSSLRGVESQRNQRKGRIRSSLNYYIGNFKIIKEHFKKYVKIKLEIYIYVYTGTLS